MVGFSFRFHPVFVKLQQLLVSELGPPWLLNGHYAFSWRPEAASWLWSPDNGGGFFNENSCHLFDAVCSLLGEPRSVMAAAETHWSAPSENAAAITIRFDNGALAALTVGGVAVSAYRDFPRIEVIAANGQAQLRGREHIWESLTWSPRNSDEVRTVTISPEALGNTRYTHAFRHFFTCIRGGQPPSATISEGVRSVALAAAVYESARTGRNVTL
jgi:predicted dehydrogenase